MLIFNNKECNPSFFQNNDRLFKINTNDYSLEELYLKALNGEDIRSLVTITAVKGFHNGTSSYSLIPMRTKILRNTFDIGEIKHFRDDNEYSPDSWNWEPGEREQVLQNETERMIVADITRRPQIADAYERKLFHQPLGASYDSLEDFTNYTNEDLILELGDALGIMPHLQSKDYTLEEQRRYSNLGKELYFHRAIMPYSEFNGLPSIEEIKNYESLAPTIRRKIYNYHNFNAMQGHPAYTLALVLKTYNKMPPDVIDNTLFDFHIYYDNNTNIVAGTEEEIPVPSYSQPNINSINDGQAIFDEATAKFTEAYRRAPQVLPEMILACKEANYFMPKEKIVETLLKGFNLQSLQMVAKYKNLSLFYLGNFINYREIKESHIPIFGANTRPTTIKTAIDHGFLPWYEKYKSEISDSDLETIVQHFADGLHFNLNRTPKDLIQLYKNAQGYSDKETYEERYHFSFDDNIVAIKGCDTVITMGGYKMYILPPEDIRNFTVGYDTSCCQHLGGAGEECTYKAVTDPYAGICVIEKNGKIKAQGFIWTDEAKDTFVFDNVEFANADGVAERDRVNELLPMFGLFADSMPYANIHIGTGYNENMAGVGKKITDREFATMPTNISSARIYSDYHEGTHYHPARTIKQNGRTLIDTNNKCFVSTDSSLRRDYSHHPFYELLKPENAWINTINSSMSSKFEILREKDIINTKSAEEQFRLVQKVPILIQFIEHPSDDIQRFIIQNHRNLISSIQNANESLLNDILLEDSPKEINNPNRHFTVEQQIRVYRNHPDYLRNAPEYNHNVLLALADINAYSILSAPKEYITQDIQLRAINQNPQIISTFGERELMGRKTLYHYDRTLLNAAINKDMGILRIIGPTAILPEDIMQEAVRADASFINSFNNPSKEAVDIAIEQNPLLIRNYQYKYPDLAVKAVRLNPRVINIITQPTQEMFEAIPDVSFISVPRFKTIYLDMRAGQTQPVQNPSISELELA